MSDLMHAVDEIRDHCDEYARSWDYYEGDVPELFVSDAVKRALKGGMCGFDVNLARRPVDAVLDRMRIVSVTVPGNDAATRWLVDTVLTPNRFDRLSKRVHRRAAAQGDSYVTVWPDDDGNVRLHFNGPGTTRVFYSDEDEQVKEYGARLWKVGKGDEARYRCDLYYEDRIEPYVTKPGGKGKADNEWEPHTDDEGTWPLPNEYGIPIFHFRTDEPYGRPLHKGAFGAQNAITKLLATMMSTVDYQGFPQRYKLLHGPKATDASASAVEGAWADTDGTNPNDGEPALQGGPATILGLDAAGVGQFDPANVDAFLKPLAFFARGMAASTATPLRFFEPSGDVPSGESLRADDAPLAHRISDLEELLGEEWQAVCAFAAAMAGNPLPEVDIQWAPVHTVNDEEGWRTALLKQQAGVPTRQVLTEAGYLSDLVEGWLQDSDTSSLDQRIATLGEIGLALQKLGAAAALGVVDKETVAVIIAQTMGDLIREGPDVATVSPEVLDRIDEDEAQRLKLADAIDQPLPPAGPPQGGPPPPRPPGEAA